MQSEIDFSNCKIIYGASTPLHHPPVCLKQIGYTAKGITIQVGLFNNEHRHTSEDAPIASFTPEK